VVESKDLIWVELDPKPVSFVRLVASDIGIMRSIYAKEGEQQQVGDLLALLTTVENELIDQVDEVLAHTSVFRVVADIIERF
jgi:hypothetical protein